ncbi:hypothetical protein CFP66_37670 [Pseudonocardia sp. MH-G8]|nr:hypothetical protein CFP66_37670 [Pseudonocardia sp. MH-G8]
MLGETALTLGQAVERTRLPGLGEVEGEHPRSDTAPRSHETGRLEDVQRVPDLVALEPEAVAQHVQRLATEQQTSQDARLVPVVLGGTRHVHRPPSGSAHPALEAGRGGPSMFLATTEAGRPCSRPS